MTMQQLGNTMTAAEFGLHMALEREEPLPQAVMKALSELRAALSNGPLQAPAPGRTWHAHDFMPTLWADVSEPLAAGDGSRAPSPEDMTVEQILARARSVGMVH